LSRDELGSTEQVKKGIEKALKHKQYVVVDCVNMHPKDRIMWATVSRAVCPSVRLVRVFVDTPKEECIARARARKNHATLSPENAEAAIEMFAKGFKPPHENELGKMGKYELVETVTNTESQKAVVEKLILILK
jgi:predicted kinase